MMMRWALEKRQPPPTEESACSPLHMPPPNFLCPMTLQVMREPVMDHDGHNFERAAILHWIQRGEDNIGIGICPISHKPLQKCDLIPNASLKKAIRRWLTTHGYCRINDIASGASDNDDNECSSGRTTVDDEQNDDADSNSQHEMLLEEEAKFTCKEDNLELGVAIKSLSTVLSAKEGYVAETSEDETSTNSHSSDVEEPVQVGLPSGDISASLLLNMFLPQEREAMARAQRRTREREESQRLTRLVHVSIAMSAVVVSLLLILFLTKLARSVLVHK